MVSWSPVIFVKKTILFACVLVAVADVANAQNQLPPGTRTPGCGAGLQLPDGFCASVFAEGAAGARHLVIAPNGDVFDGSLFITDDTGGTVWRVFYQGNRR
jgi:hypothetical protein